MLMTAAIASPNLSLSRAASRRAAASPLAGAGHDLGHAQRGPSESPVVALERGPGDDRLDAARSARSSTACAPRDRVVAPLSRDAVEPAEDLPVDDDAPAAACAEDEAQDDAAAAAGSEEGLGQGEAVGVVGGLASTPSAAPGPRERWPFRHNVFEFLRTPLAGSMTPGVPNPIHAGRRVPDLRSSIRTSRVPI
jgi:hypothetical protein